LKQFVGEPGDRGKLPTARQLRESGAVVARERFGGEAEISVYQDGCVLYQVGSRATVFSIRSCGDYFYTSDGDAVHLPGQYFDRERWYLRLVLEGEDRLDRNREEKERSRKVSYSAESEEWAVMEDAAEPAIERLARQETVEEMLQTLTEKQKTVICGYYLQEKTQGQIAEELGISRHAVRDSLLRAVNKIRKKYPLCSHGFQCGMAGNGAAQ
jgi:RNA polymerase sigma factor, sigma-70 family